MIDIKVAGEKAQKDLSELHSQEFGRMQHTDQSVASTLLKVLTLMAGIFFSFICATTLPPEIAFINVTLIAVGALAILAGAEKIVAIFPRNIFIWKNHYPTHHHPDPPRSWRNWRPSMPGWGRSNSSRNSRGHSVNSSRSGGHSANSNSSSSSSSPWWQPSSYANRSDRPPGSGHSSGPVAGGTNNVARGGGHADRKTTPSGKVIPGGRR